MLIKPKWRVFIMIFNPTRSFTHVMSARTFCSIAFQEQIDYRSGKGKKVRTDEERIQILDNYISKLTPGIIKQHNKKVCDYLNSCGGYTLPIGKIIVDEITN